MLLQGRNARAAPPPGSPEARKLRRPRSTLAWNGSYDASKKVSDMASDKSGNTGGKPGTTTGEGGFKGRRVTTCSFCGKTSREVGPMVEGPNDVYI